MCSKSRLGGFRAGEIREETWGEVGRGGVELGASMDVDGGVEATSMKGEVGEGGVNIGASSTFEGCPVEGRCVNGVECMEFANCTLEDCAVEECSVAAVRFVTP